MFTIRTILSKIHNFWRKKCSVRGEKMVGLEIFFPPFLTFYRFTRTVQWYFVKGGDLKVPYTRPSIAWSEFSLAGAIFYTYVLCSH